MPKVFISYSHKDEDWKNRLQTQLAVLENQGLLSVWDDRKIAGGDDWYSEIEQAIESAQVAILLISADFLSSKFIQGKEVPPLLERRKKDGLRVIPLILKPCPWQMVEWLSKIQGRPIDNKPLSGFDEHNRDHHLSELALEINKLLSTLPPITKPDAPEYVAPSSTPKPTYDPRNRPFYVPYRQKGDQVIGRDEAMAAVRQQLTAGRRTAIGQTAVFQGIGGLGKTQLAVEYAYNFSDAYPNGVIWLTADQDIDAQLVDLAVKARWVAPESEHKFKLEIAQHRLRSYSDCLIVFDNLEQLSSIHNYLPEPTAQPHILVTSREEQPNFSYVPIDVLQSAQSLQLLLQEAGRQPDSETEWTAAREISDRLGGLPLALEMAGAYLYRRLVSWQDYLDLLKHNLKRAFTGEFPSLTGHKADLYSTLQVSASVFVEEPRLKDILDVLTWSAPSPMSVELLVNLLGVTDRSELTGALGLGAALRLLQQTPGSDAYAIHRLVREVRREQTPLIEKSAWAAELCQKIGDWFFILRKDFQHLPRFEANIDHLREWHDHALQLATQQASRLTWLQAYPAYHRGQFQEIKRLIELALNEYEKQGCVDRPLLAHLYHDQAFSLKILGNPKGALVLAEQALDIRRELFGETHPDTAQSLNSVAAVINDLGNQKRALELAEQALDIRRELFGENHPDTAQSLNSVASYIYKLGNPQRALELTEQALANRRKLFGERHPDTANSLSNIAAYINALGNPQRALELAEQALVIRRELFGERHPSTASSLSNVASYTDKLGNPQRALELAEQALSIRRELFGERHLSTAASLHNLSSYLLDCGKNQQAYAHAQAAYATLKQILGQDHPDTLNTAKLLARINLPGRRLPPSKKVLRGNKKKRKK